MSNRLKDIWRKTVINCKVLEKERK